MSDWIEVLFGLAMILAGAELLVRGATALALRLSVTPMVIGLTVVAIGTSLPEAAVTIQAVRLGVAEMGVGAILGSNIFNIAAILGVATLINPVTIDSRMLKMECPFVFFGTGLTYLAARDGEISQAMGLMMFIAATFFFVWLGFAVRKIRRRRALEEAESTIDFGRGLGLPAALGAIVVGLVLLKFGGDFSIDASTRIALDSGWSHRFVGLTILAFGTSAPELAVCVVASLRKQTDLAIGNIIGSCLFNLMIIMGGAAIFRPLTMSDRVLSMDFPFLVALTLFLLVVLVVRNTRNEQLRRLEGAMLVLAFVCYYATVLFSQSVA